MTAEPKAYPETAADRDRWIIGHRGHRNHLDPFQPYAFIVEEEPRKNGVLARVATIFLTNRECPWRCLMCDLWRNTLTESVPVGAIPAQIDFALKQLPITREIKLYNAGSFFDPRAIPIADWTAIAERVRSFDRVIVECHPSLVGESSLQFRDAISGRLQIAMGLETVHPDVLSRLNKRMTLQQFEKACAFLRKHEIESRMFVLLKPPFMNEADGVLWAKRSIEFGFSQGAEVISVIPTRLGNGALEALASQSQFEPPTLASLEAVLEHGLQLQQGVVLADLWDVEQFSRCSICFTLRKDRLQQMNQEQKLLPSVTCECSRVM